MFCFTKQKTNAKNKSAKGGTNNEEEKNGETNKKRGGEDEKRGKGEGEIEKHVFLF